MDYTTAPLLFKAKKAARYVRLFGPRRTFVKVKSQYHMNKSYSDLPKLSGRANHSGHVGIIGCGNFAYSTLAYYLTKNYGRVIRGTMDRGINRAASLAESYGAAYYTTDIDEIINDSSIDLVYIASNHASHAEYAIACLDAGKHVHIEKPHVVTNDQLERLCRAMSDARGRVSLGFNRPHSQFGQRIRAALESQTGAAMFNWFIAGHQIEPDHWYFKEEEGGRVLGNLCHWTDFTYDMVRPENRFPISIHPTRAEKSDCDISVSYVFGDGTIGTITFSAKGHVFEGVRERFSAHKGDVLLSLEDFKRLVIDDGDRRWSKTLLFRDHGHEAAVKRSYAMSGRAGESNPGYPIEHVWETAALFLETKAALESAETRVLQRFSHDANLRH